jgi:hypothetical protein
MKRTGKVPPKTKNKKKITQNKKNTKKKIKQLSAFNVTNFGIFFLINGLTRQALQNAMIFRIIYHDKDPFC